MSTSMTTAVVAASPLETLAAALDHPTTVTTTTTTPLCPASRINLQALCSCFAFLTPKELISTHATSHTFQRAAEHPLTFRSQIRVQLKEKSGLWSSGPRVVFSNPRPMELALKSSLFGNFRIVHLIDQSNRTTSFGNADQGENSCQMFTLAAQFKSLHSLKLSSCHPISEQDIIEKRSKSISQLFTSPACKYLQVLIFELTLSEMRQLFADGVLVHLQSLQHLQFTIVDDAHVLPSTFATELLKLPQLRIVVVAFGQLLTSLNAPLFQKPKITSAFTTTSDLVQLMQLSHSPTIEKIAWMYPFSFKSLDVWCRDIDTNQWPHDPSKFDTLYMSDVDSSQMDVFFRFLQKFFSSLTSLTIFSLTGTPSQLDPWPIALRTKLLSLSVVLNPPKSSGSLPDVVPHIQMLTNAGLKSLETFSLSFRPPGDRSTNLRAPQISGTSMTMLFQSMPHIRSLELEDVRWVDDGYPSEYLSPFFYHPYQSLPSLTSVKGISMPPPLGHLNAPEEGVANRSLNDIFPSLVHMHMCGETLVTQFDPRYGLPKRSEQLTRETGELVLTCPKLEWFSWAGGPRSNMRMLHAYVDKIRRIQAGFKKQQESFNGVKKIERPPPPPPKSTSTTAVAVVADDVDEDAEEDEDDEEEETEESHSKRLMRTTNGTGYCGCAGDSHTCFVSSSSQKKKKSANTKAKLNHQHLQSEFRASVLSTLAEANDVTRAEREKLIAMGEIDSAATTGRDGMMSASERYRARRSARWITTSTQDELQPSGGGTLSTSTGQPYTMYPPSESTNLQIYRPSEEELDTGKSQFGGKPEAMPPFDANGRCVSSGPLPSPLLGLGLVWSDLWLETLEKASYCYQYSQFDRLIRVLEPVHVLMQSITTPDPFIIKYGSQLQNAYSFLQQCELSKQPVFGSETVELKTMRAKFMTSAWNLYSFILQALKEEKNAKKIGKSTPMSPSQPDLDKPIFTLVPPQQQQQVTSASPFQFSSPSFTLSDITQATAPSSTTSSPSSFATPFTFNLQSSFQSQDANERTMVPNPFQFRNPFLIPPSTQVQEASAPCFSSSTLATSSANSLAAATPTTSFTSIAPTVATTSFLTPSGGGPGGPMVPAELSDPGRDDVVDSTGLVHGGVGDGAVDELVGDDELASILMDLTCKKEQ